VSSIDFVNELKYHGQSMH